MNTIKNGLKKRSSKDRLNFWRDLARAAESEANQLIESNIKADAHGSIPITPTSPYHSLIE